MLYVTIFNTNWKWGLKLWSNTISVVSSKLYKQDVFNLEHDKCGVKRVAPLVVVWHSAPKPLQSFRLEMLYEKNNQMEGKYD